MSDISIESFGRQVTSKESSSVVRKKSLRRRYGNWPTAPSASTAQADIRRQTSSHGAKPLIEVRAEPEQKQRVAVSEF